MIKPAKDKLHFVREVVESLKTASILTPVIVMGEYNLECEKTCIHVGAELGASLCDGLVDGILVINQNLPLKKRREIGLNLLQACRLRASKTEFISCPSCGRTLFELQSVTKKVQERTSHLPGVKIAVMGCIVNGPGEMADADFGYVGFQSRVRSTYMLEKSVWKKISITVRQSSALSTYLKNRVAG